MAKLHRLILMAALLTLGACSSLFGTRDPLRIDLVGLEPAIGQGMEARFTVKLRVQNPNDQAIDYDGIALDLSVNGQPLASGVSDASGQVPRFGETVISVPVSISLSLRSARPGACPAVHRARACLRISGKLAGGLFGTVRFNDKGVLNWPEPVARP